MANYLIEQDQVYAGFEKGPLAGLSPEEREEKKHSYIYYDDYWRYERLLSRSRAHQISGSSNKYRRRDYWLNSCETKAAVGSSLAETLNGCNCVAIRRALCAIQAPKPPSQRKADLVAQGIEQLPAATEDMAQLLATTSRSAFELLVQALTERAVKTEAREARETMNQVFPYAFISTSSGKSEAFMPPEIKAAFGKIDLVKARHNRMILETVEDLLYASVVLCGVASKNDLFDAFCAQVPSSELSMDKFESLLDDVCSRTSFAQRVEIADTDYYVHAKLLSYRCIEDRQSNGYPQQTIAAAAEAVLDSRCEGMASPILSGRIPNNDPAAYVYGLPCVMALANYFDAHVPEEVLDSRGEVLSFSEKMVDQIIEEFLFKGTSLRYMIYWLTAQGWSRAEGTNIAPKLSRLVLDVYRQLPRWELNGWSEQEFCEMQGMGEAVSESLLADVQLFRAA